MVKSHNKTMRIQIATAPRLRRDQGKRFTTRSILTLVSLAISGLGVQRTHRWLTRVSTPFYRARVGCSDRDQALLQADLWRQRLETEAATLSLRAECSEVSLSLYALLLMSGHRGTVVIGHRRLHEGLQGHTWLTLAGQVVSELGEPDSAYPLLHVHLT